MISGCVLWEHAATLTGSPGSWQHAKMVGLESVQLSTLHSLTHFIGGEQKMPKSSVGIKTVFDSHFTATVFHYNSCLNHLMCLAWDKAFYCWNSERRTLFRAQNGSCRESLWQVTEYRSSVFAWHKVIKRENPWLKKLVTFIRPKKIIIKKKNSKQLFAK